MNIIIDTHKNKLKLGHEIYACALGKEGAIIEMDGREGDGKTPLGHYTLRYGLYRADRVCLPKCALQFYPIEKNDGWCDAPYDPAYNRPVRLPYPASTEKLYKSGHVYDIIIVLGHNDGPPVPNMGSAIFLHVAKKGYTSTQGCIALNKKDMLCILPKLTAGMKLEIIGNL